MRALGRLIALWGAVLPVLAFLSGRGFDPRLGLLPNLMQMSCYLGEAEIGLPAVAALGVILVALGLSGVVLAPARK